MDDENKKSIKEIERYYDRPTVVGGVIEDNCTFENSLMPGYGTIIIDKDFINDMASLIKKEEIPKNFVDFITLLNTKINNYFYSNNESNQTRMQVYDSCQVTDNYGMVLGSKLSDFKGKNVALCSEKALGAYIVLRQMYQNGLVHRDPRLVLSYLETDVSPSIPHAFLLLNKEEDVYPTKHMLFDIENLSLIEDNMGNKHNFVGLYTLSDEEYELVINGIKCSPTSLFEVMNPNLHNVGDKRTYGSLERGRNF